MITTNKVSRGTALRSLTALGLSQALKVLMQIASVVVLSRLLTPSDFGLMAAVGPVIGFMTIFQDLGLQQAIIQRAEITEQDLTSIFWVTSLLGCTIVFATILASPLIAWFFHDPRILLVTIVASTPLLTSALAAVPAALLNRQGRFRVLAQNDILTSIAGLAVAVSAAFLGARYWSLVISSVATSFLGAALVIWQAEWVPRTLLRTWPDKALMEFGRGLTGFTLVNYFARNADNLLIGHIWGSTQLGYYDRAYKLLLFPLQNISYPVSRVMIPMLSRLDADKVSFRRTYIRVVSQLTLAVVPGMAAAVATAPTLILFVFGDRWNAITPLFVWLGLSGLIQPLNSTAGWIFIAQARTTSMFQLGLLNSCIAIMAFIVGLPWGAAGVAIAYCLSDYLIRLPIQNYWIGCVGPVTTMDLFGVQMPLLAAAAVTYIVATFCLVRQFHLHGGTLLIVTVVFSYCIAILAVNVTRSGRDALVDGLRTALQAAGFSRLLGPKASEVN